MNNEKYNLNKRNYYLNNIPIEEALETYFEHLEHYFNNNETEEILVTIDFREWKPDKQFYSPKIDIPGNLFKWENLSPNNLEILVVDREEPIKEN